MNKFKLIQNMALRKILIFSILFFCGCEENNLNKNNLTNSNTESNSSLTRPLPFVGKRSFETRPGVSGTGTPHRQVEIRRDSIVEFSFEQENQADETITKGFYIAGKFTDVIKCVFKEWDDEVRFYRIMPDKIYEVDSNGVKLKLDECCDQLELGCPCESEYFSF